MNKHGIDEQELRNFCQREGHAGAYKEFLSLSNGLKDLELETMETIEQYIIEQTLASL